MLKERATATPDDRYPAIDILRGAALFGVLLVNLLTAFRVPLLQHLADFHTHPGRANQIVDLACGVFLEEKAITIFSTLFGVGMAIQCERSRERGAGYAWLGLRRLLTLAVLGLLHSIFIWNGDILTLYALAGLLVLPALFLPERAGLAVAAVLLLLRALPLHLPLPQLPWEALRGHSAQATRIYAHGSYREILPFRLHETAVVFIPLLGQILPRTMGLMLLGQSLWRRGILREPERHRTLLRGVAGLGIPLGVLVNCGQAAAAYAEQSLAPWTGLLDALSTTPLALGYAAALLLLLQRPAVRRTLNAAESVGRMALSCYLSQSVILGLVFYGYGLGLFGRLGSAAAAPLGFLIYGLQMIGSRLWLRRYRFGPVEWLWRAATYGRLPPLRRTERAA